MTPLRMRTLPTPIAPLLLHTCKRYTCLPVIDSTAPPPGGATRKKSLTRARRLDADLGTPPGAKGPFVTELETFGRGGKVIIPVAGAFAEMSPDVYAIIDLVATALTCEHLSYYDAYPSVVKGMFQQRIYRSLGLAAHLGWARLVIDRTKANIRYPTPATAQVSLTPL